MMNDGPFYKVHPINRRSDKKSEEAIREWNDAIKQIQLRAEEDPYAYDPKLAGESEAKADHDLIYDHRLAGESEGWADSLHYTPVRHKCKVIHPLNQVVKGQTPVEYAGWKFLQLMALGLAFVCSIGVSWGMAGLFGWHLLALFLTWAFWISLILYAFVFAFRMCWWAYQRGVFDD